MNINIYHVLLDVVTDYLPWTSKVWKHYCPCVCFCDKPEEGNQSNKMSV